MSRVKCNFAAVQAELSKHNVSVPTRRACLCSTTVFFPAISTRVVRYIKEEL